MYTILVILATLALRRLMLWLTTPRAPGADQAGGPEPCPPAPSPPRFYSSESSSQGSSLVRLTVDNQGREVNRHLSVEERRQARILSSSSIQEEPEQEVAAETTLPAAEPAEEEETLHYPTERDYRDMRADESWEPSMVDASQPQPSQAAPKAFPRAFQADDNPAGRGDQGAERLGVYITKYGQKYHVFRECQTLTSSLLRHQNQCTSDLGRDPPSRRSSASGMHNAPGQEV